MIAYDMVSHSDSLGHGIKSSLIEYLQLHVSHKGGPLQKEFSLCLPPAHVRSSCAIYFVELQRELNF